MTHQFIIGRRYTFRYANRHTPYVGTYLGRDHLWRLLFDMRPAFGTVVVDPDTLKTIVVTRLRGDQVLKCHPNTPPGR